MKQMTFKEFFQTFPSDDVCLEHMMKVRYGLEHKCRKCDRDSKFSRVSSQRAYACQFCGDHVYPCVGTPFEASRTSLQTWFYAIYLFTTSRHGVSAKELQRQLGVTYKCAWRMGHEIRKHMADVDGETPLSGIVEVDETYVGGKSKGKRGRGADGKTVVFGMLERDGVHVNGLEGYWSMLKKAFAAHIFTYLANIYLTTQKNLNTVITTANS